MISKMIGFTFGVALLSAVLIWQQPQLWQQLQQLVPGKNLLEPETTDLKQESIKSLPVMVPNEPELPTSFTLVSPQEPSESQIKPREDDKVPLPTPDDLWDAITQDSHVQDNVIANELAVKEPVHKTQPIETEMTTAANAQWHPVWQNFYSRISAQGFANHLKSITALPIRVTGSELKGFEVQVGYLQQTQLQQQLEHIDQVTGLNLAGTVL